MEFFVMACIFTLALALSGRWCYGLGRKHGAEAQREWFERVEAVEPTTRAAGQPTNVDGPPARINRPRWRQGMLRGGDAHKQ